MVVVTGAVIAATGFVFARVAARAVANDQGEHAEHFYYGNQVSMINNATAAPYHEAMPEIPVYMPFPVMPKDEEKNEGTPATDPPPSPSDMPPGKPPEPAAPPAMPPAAAPQAPAPGPGAPPAASPPGMPPSKSTPNPNADGISGPGPLDIEVALNANPHCINPQYVVCEVAPAPVFSINGFKFDGTPGTKISQLGPLVQRDTEMQPSYKEDARVRYFAFDGAKTLVNDAKETINLPISQNGGCSIVALVRCTDVDNPDYTIASLNYVGTQGKTYSMAIEDFKHYAARNTWGLWMSIYAEKDKGTSYATFLDAVDRGEELRIQQTQESIEDADIRSMGIANPVKEDNSTGVDIAYVGFYDRALTPYERLLIRASCEQIIAAPPPRAIEPRVVADYDLTTITDAYLNTSPDLRRMVKDMSPSKFNLVYNVDGRDAVFQTRVAARCVEMTKNEKFYAASSSYVDLTSGYTFELLFMVRQFSQESDSVIMCYATLENNLRAPQIIIAITPSKAGMANQVEGHRLSVFYQSDMLRFETNETLKENKWYHAIITSESEMFINGEKAKTTGRAVATLQLVASQSRYITIGDYKNADGQRVSADAGNTMNGFYALARIYNYPLSASAAREAYRKAKSVGKNLGDTGEGNKKIEENVYGLP